LNELHQKDLQDSPNLWLVILYKMITFFQEDCLIGDFDNIVKHRDEKQALKPGRLFYSFCLNKKKQKFKALNNYWLF